MLPIPAIILLFAFVVSSNAEELDIVDREVIDLGLPLEPPVIPMLPFYIRADNGKYLTPLDESDFYRIKATADKPDAQSIFKPMRDDGKLYLISSNGRYVCVINFTGRIGARHEEPSNRCPLEAVKNDDGTVSFKYLYKNKYMCRVNTERDQSSIRANKDKIDSTCKFTIEEVKFN